MHFVRKRITRSSLWSPSRSKHSGDFSFPRCDNRHPAIDRHFGPAELPRHHALIFPGRPQGQHLALILFGPSAGSGLGHPVQWQGVLIRSCEF